MTRNRWWPSRNGDQVTCLTNLKTKLPGHAPTLGIAGGDATVFVADCEWLIYVLKDWLPAVRTFAEACTNAAKTAHTGTGSAAMVLPTFTPPAGGTPVEPGAFDRIVEFVQKEIKDSAGYTEAIGQDLGVIGSEKGAPDWDVFGPVLKIKRAPAGVTVEWDWQGKREFLDMIELQVDRGTGWELLAYDTTPGYVDTAPIPATPVKWQYRAIYRVGDQRIGQWSGEMAVNVGG